MTVFLIILAVLFLLLLLVLFVDVLLVFSLDDDVSIRLKVLFFSWDVQSLVEKFAKKDTPDTEAEEKPNGEKKKGRLRTPDEILRIIEYFISLVKAIVHEFFRYVRLKICHVYVKVATDDAARTAQFYGSVSGLVYGLIALFDNTMSVKKSDKKIRVFPDFTTDSSEVRMKLVLKIKPIHALFAVMHLLPLFMNRKVG